MSAPPFTDTRHTTPLMAKPVSSSTQREVLIGQSREALRQLMGRLGEPAFRAEQLYHWLYVRCERDWDSMTNLAKPFRQRLADTCAIGTLTPDTIQQSQDGTRKYLFRLSDGQVVESVLMHFQERDTYAVCLSTQVGCAVDCSFCATGKLGFKRNLSVSEIVEQYLFVQHESEKEVRNVVFMGQGEPLLNLPNVLPAVHLLNEAAEVGMRRMTISTSGIVPQIYTLAQEALPITLAVSLHAPNDAIRGQLMPINRKWPLAELMPALHHYVEKTHRRLTIEYILIDGLNDQAAQARELGKLLHGLRCNVNLIPYNPIHQQLPGAPMDYRRSRPSAVDRFRQIVSDYGKKVTVRLERGADIDAACGQLANRL
ncbi:MAG: 23S rRNA (adenine(2503)-C(2))-methyltransferase RlmN [Candidatus Melainabacteria bacterium]|nr:23S rRNA (adenine(2503)-C(2))-methyltransferase RlmN [Candidatus Melainabacteria bacterium]